MGCRFVPDWNHAQESYVSIFSFFPLPCLQDHDLWRSRKFATLTTWLSDFTSLLQGCTRNWVKLRPPKQSLSAIWHNTCADSKWLMLSRVRGGEQGGGGGGGDRGAKSSASTALHSWLPHFFPGLLPLALFRLRNIKDCVISPASRLFRTFTSRPFIFRFPYNSRTSAPILPCSRPHLLPTNVVCVQM